LICRILEGTFPDHEQAISTDNDKKVTFDVKALMATTQRVALLTGDRARSIRLHLSPDLLVVSTANPDLGEAVEEMPCEYSGPELQIGINPDYLSQFLAVVEGEKVRFEFKDGNSQCLAYPLDGQDRRFLCVIMPMRI
jgi:DNA polymerase-3 subunit beta